MFPPVSATTCTVETWTGRANSAPGAAWTHVRWGDRAELHSQQSSGASRLSSVFLRCLHTTAHRAVNVPYIISFMARRWWHFWSDDFSVRMLTLSSFQEDSGGPLMCSHKNKYTIVGIISSGKGWVAQKNSWNRKKRFKFNCVTLCFPRCGSYPGLYTDVARYVDWIVSMTNLLENEIEWNWSNGKHISSQKEQESWFNDIIIRNNDLKKCDPNSDIIHISNKTVRNFSDKLSLFCSKWHNVFYDEKILKCWIIVSYKKISILTLEWLNNNK